MALRKITILPHDVKKARVDIYNHPDELAQRKALCLVMKSLFYTDEQIAEVIGINRHTVRNYLDLYEEQGYVVFMTNNYNKPKSELDDFRELIKTEFDTNPAQSLKEARERIFELTGIDRSTSRVYKYLKKIGIKRLKSGHMPGKADPVKQKEFHDNTLQPLLKKAKKGKIEVLFLDAAHFVLSGFVGFLWCFVRIFIKSPSGRFRLNVIAAMNAITKEVTGIANETYITATTVIELLNKIAEEYKGKKVYIVLDNARYQHCKAVIELAAKLKIKLVFLPTYSPNLNLIERLWKYVKSEVCTTKYYDNAKAFKTAILDFLNTLDTPEKSKEMQSRMTLNFQLFPCV
jgi:transposase